MKTYFPDQSYPAHLCTIWWYKNTLQNTGVCPQDFILNTSFGLHNYSLSNGANEPVRWAKGGDGKEKK